MATTPEKAIEVFYSYVQVRPKEGSGGGLWSDAEEMCRVNG